MLNDDIFTLIMSANESMLKADLGIEDSYEAYAMECALESACYEDESYGWNYAMENDAGTTTSSTNSDSKSGFWVNLKNGIIKVLKTIWNVISFIPKWIAKKIKEWSEKARAKKQEKEENKQKQEELNNRIDVEQRALREYADLVCDNVLKCTSQYNILATKHFAVTKELKLHLAGCQGVSQPTYSDEKLSQNADVIKENGEEIVRIENELKDDFDTINSSLAAKKDALVEKFPTVTNIAPQTLYEYFCKLESTKNASLKICDKVKDICDASIEMSNKICEPSAATRDMSENYRKFQLAIAKTILNMSKSLLGVTNTFQEITYYLNFFN